MVQSGTIPNLKVLNVVSPSLSFTNASMADEKYQLAKANVSVYLPMTITERELKD